MKRVGTRLLVMVVVAGMMLATALPALAAPQQGSTFTCTNPNNSSQTFTLTAKQYEMLVKKHPEAAMFCMQNP
ncbi:MAG: hypothetical protein LC751_07735 [Actinobacteria bacterium]|nr:hypothetical protein [Actinomycetota bacterium]